jgi:hypothetical protein
MAINGHQIFGNGHNGHHDGHRWPSDGHPMAIRWPSRFQWPLLAIMMAIMIASMSIMAINGHDFFLASSIKQKCEKCQNN